MKINISFLESKLGYRIKRNAYCVAFDTATITGIAMVLTDNEYMTIKTDLIKLPPTYANDEKEEKYISRLEFVLEWARQFSTKIKNKKGSILVLENSFMSFNAYTFGLLKAMSGILFSEFYDKFETIRIIFPSVARKEAGFKSMLPKGATRKAKKEEIVKWINSKFGTTETDDNITDAILLSLCGLKDVK